MTETLKIPQIIESKVFADDRGIFSPFIDGSEFGIKRVYYVVNPFHGTIRGFHFHKIEWKYFVIVQGSAKFVAINPEKPEEKYTFVSSERKPNTILIPANYANGWVSLENNTILLCASTSTTQESLADDKRFDPMQWGDVWSTKPR
mgnify:CR=1 FL=1